jgi:predicted phage terminase large subunit-like protein
VAQASALGATVDTLIVDNPGPPVSIPLAELVKLCAVDSELYAKTFFPKTFRQESPSFAKELWSPLEDSAARLVNILAFRGSSKTTRARTFASKRIAYGISRTILYVGASERDAIRSVQWVRTQVERNNFWRQTFRLRPGRKWEETQIEIEHEGFGHTIWLLAAGITGSLRGINFDDYRPDLIIGDDVQTDEMAASLEQRDKIEDLMLGAVKNSLASTIDEPNAKLVMLNTPQHKDDVTQKALSDPQWVSRVIPCWTKETMDLDVDKQMSAWEAGHPTQELRADKKAHIARNKLSVFSREKECRLLSAETAQFRPMWLNIREPGIKPQGCYSVLAIDPVPPPSERAKAKGLRGNDWEAHYVWGRHNGEYHLLDCDRSRGHEPSWTIATAFRLARQYRVSRIVVDAVNYQKTLKWLLEQEMKRRGVYYTVIPVDDKMQKFARITSVIGGLASQGLLWSGAEFTNFIQQFNDYGPTYGGNDDDIDASALALQDISNPYLERLDDKGNLRDDDVEELEFVRGCP